jgi:cytosine/adenosine deaminase-related metal-dependent hydrolase
MPSELVIRGAVARGRPCAVRVSRGLITEISPDLTPRAGERVIDLEGLALLPGLVNAHDHLNLDLLPPLGNPPYANSYEWDDDLRRNYPAVAVQHQPVPEVDRFRWGAYRNLFSGVTTVAHHGPFPIQFLAEGTLPIRLRLPMAWAESLRRGPDVASRARHARGRMPFAIHLAEGVDDVAAREIDSLDGEGALGAGTMVVHGVGLDARGRRLLAERGAALVWCPRSNHFLFGATAAVAELPPEVPVALATDSTMTGSVTLFDELRFAAGLGQVPAERLLAMVTSEAATAVMAPELGRLTVGAPADLIALPPAGSDAETLLAARPGALALVVVGGRVRLAAPRHAWAGDLESTILDGARIHVQRGLGALVDRLRRALPEGFPSPALAQIS